MRTFLVLGGIVSVVTVFGVVACGDDDASPGTDAGTTSDTSTASDTSTTSDTSTGNDTGSPDAPTDSPAEGGANCTGVTAKGQVASGFTPQGQPPLPITIEWDGCPQTAQAVAASPFPTFQLEIGSGESYFRTKTTGYYTTNSQHLQGSIAALVPSALIYAVKTIPGYDATKGHVVISLNAVKSSCTNGTKVGSVVTAPGHPEAVVKYVDDQGVEAVGATSMTTAARAVIVNLNPSVGNTVSPVVTVGGGATCTQKTLFFSGKAAVVANTVTVWQTEIE